MSSHAGGSVDGKDTPSIVIRIRTTQVVEDRLRVAVGELVDVFL